MLCLSALLLSKLVSTTAEDVVWPMPGSVRSSLALAVPLSCPTYTGPTLRRTKPRPNFPSGVLVVAFPLVNSAAAFRTQWQELKNPSSPCLDRPGSQVSRPGTWKSRVEFASGGFATGWTFVGSCAVYLFSPQLPFSPFVTFKRLSSAYTTR
ncbi:hypothetical protein R3P38DRAFT_2846029 [Favolaschia claudopus]|uniref:Secreted protein n=1 Tax=Favolaschia claudopus TaxID=2862362 RepID=A0AAW0DUF8_9AGAR